MNRLTPMSEKHLRGMTFPWAIEVMAEIDALRAELKEALQNEQSSATSYANVRKALSAAQNLINEFHSYSTGVSCMAEEDVAELFGVYSALSDGLVDQATNTKREGQ